MPEAREGFDEDWSPTEELAKGVLDYLEQLDVRDPLQLRAAILATERASVTNPVAPLIDNPHAHCAARMLRLLRSLYVHLHSAADKGR